MDSTEVICISSDDDESSGESKPTVPDNCIRSEGERKEEEPSILKRKIALQEVIDTVCVQAKRLKMSLSQTENNNVSLGNRNCTNSESTCGSQDIGNARKPRLVIKEKRSISPVEQHPFPMFISLCLQKDRSEEMTIIVNKLKTRYEQLDPVYSKSPEFMAFLNQQREAIMNSRKQFYSYIQIVMNEMKYSIKGQSQLIENGESSNASVKRTERNGETSNDNTNSDDTKKNIKRELRIKRIDLAMGECQARIERLENEDIDFDDEENSNYMKLERYKKRMVELYNARCHLTGERTDAGRPYLRPKHLTPTGIAAVDAAITNFINSKIKKWNCVKKKKKSGVDAVIFPDYVDILRCIRSCNESRNLGLTIKKQREIAKKAFIQLGENLQRMRFNDYWDTFSFYLENEQEDPALNDSDLTSKLMQNKKDGDKRLASVFQEFAEKQEAGKDHDTEGNGTTNPIVNQAEDEEEDDVEDEEMDDSADENEENSETDQNSTVEDDLESTANSQQSDTRKNKRLSNEDDATVNNVHGVDNDESEVIELDDDNEINGDTIVSESNRNCVTSIEPLKEKFFQEEYLESASVRKSPQATDTTVTIPLTKQLALSNTVSSTKMTPEVTNDSEGKNLPDIETQGSENDTQWQRDGRDSAQKDRQEEKVGDNARNKEDEEDSAPSCKEDDDTLNDCSTKNVNGDNENPEGEEQDDKKDERSVEETQEISKNILECPEQINEEDQDIDQRANQENIQEKPLLRVRAFAKPPTTWNDGEHKNEKASRSRNSSKTWSATEIVDLTDGPPTVSEHKTLFSNSKRGTILSGKPFIVKLRKLNVPVDIEHLERRGVTVKHVATGRAVIFNPANIVNGPEGNDTSQSQPIKLQKIMNKTAINGQPGSGRPQFVTVSRALQHLSVSPRQGKVTSTFSRNTHENRDQAHGGNTQDNNVSLKRSETYSAANSSK